MKEHGIGWLNVPGYVPETWNPVVGCSKVSEGCRNCYAERMAKRIFAMDGTSPYGTVTLGGKWKGITELVPSVLEKPLKWRKPRAIFVNSMGDLFHEATPVEWLDDVFDVIERCPHHLFIVLTKRAARMREWMQHSYYDRNGQQVLINVWLGVTVEDQAAAERIPHLLRTPSAVRFVSCEPLMGAVDFTQLKFVYGGYNALRPYRQQGSTSPLQPSIDWVICGGESGPGARRMDPAWARGLRDQAQAAGVPFFFKQWGWAIRPRGLLVDFLEGRQWREWPGIMEAI
jgi:protein gp37